MDGTLNRFPNVSPASWSESGMILRRRTSRRRRHSWGEYWLSLRSSDNPQVIIRIKPILTSSSGCNACRNPIPYRFRNIAGGNNIMVNQPGKPAGPGRFPAPKEGGEEVGNYEDLLEGYGARKFEEGEVMQGTALKITGTDVIVDIGYKSEGVIPVSQFIDATGQLTVAIGDVIDVLLGDTED